MGPYQSTPARRFLMGREPSINPAPAAAMLLGIGVKRPRSYSVGAARRHFTPRTRTHNPLPAAIAVATSVAKKLGIKTGSPRYEGGPLVSTVQQFLDQIKKGDLAALEQLHSLATSPAEKHRTQWAKVWNVEVPALGGSLPSKVRAAIHQLDPTSQVPAAGSSEKQVSGVQQLTNVLSSKAGLTAVTALARGAARRPRRRRVVGYDEYGQAIYAAARAPRAPRAPRGGGISATTVAGAAGAAAPAAAGVGGAGAAGALAVTGVVIGGLAVGLLIGTGLRKAFGEAKAVRAEEAAVEGALVLRQTRAQLEAQLGRKLKPTETRALFSEYTTQLQKLGFTQDTNGQWIRKRSLAERILG